MKNKFAAIVLFSIGIFSTTAMLILLHFNIEITNQLSQRDSLISRMQESDSLLTLETQEYAKIINRYITNESEFILDGKTVSAQEVISMFNEIIKKNNRLSDSLLYHMENHSFYKRNYNYILEKYLECNDSLKIYRFGFNHAADTYGFNFDIQLIDNNIILKREFSRADSALIIFPIFRDKLNKDTVAGNWLITYHERDTIQNIMIEIE